MTQFEYTFFMVAAACVFLVSPTVGQESSQDDGFEKSKTDRSSPASYPYDPAQKIELSGTFKRLKAPGTGRSVVQLTSGQGFCYPLYYFIPSLTKDLRYLVYHRAEAGQVQLHRLDLRTGESTVLTHGNCPKTRWVPWCTEAGVGILDHRSALDVAGGQVIYFTGKTGRQVHAVDIATLEDRLLFSVPDNFFAAGQNCVTPDGKRFIYIERPGDSGYRQAKGKSRVVAYGLENGKRQVLCEIDFPIHHVIAYGNEHFVFCHTPYGNGMLMTDLTSGTYRPLRAGDPGVTAKPVAGSKGPRVCHFVATARGLAYEAGRSSGLYDPLQRSRFEFALPKDFGYTHTGWDPEGRLWFWEKVQGSWRETKKGHKLVALRSIDKQRGADFVDLTGEWPTYGGGQKSHFHPQLTPDRKWILFVGGDKRTKSNHIFLLDVSDLHDTQGISREMLSKTGENNMTRPE